MEEVKSKRFKGDQKNDACLKLNFNNIDELFDKNRCAIMVDENNIKHNISFANKTSAKNENFQDDLFEEIFIRLYKLKTYYVPEYVPDSEKKPTIEIFFNDDNKKTMDIGTKVGKNIKEKFSYQKEIRFVAELACTHKINIKNVKRLEIFLNPNVKLNIEDLK